jgi:hypothetical protein
MEFLLQYQPSTSFGCLLKLFKTEFQNGIIPDLFQSPIRPNLYDDETI